MFAVLESAIEVDDKMDIIQDLSQDLESSSVNFKRRTRKTEKLYWWKNFTYSFVLMIVLLVRVFGIENFFHRDRTQPQL
jgi:hypothetical protein